VNRYLVDVRRTRQSRESVENFVTTNIQDPASVLFGIFIKGDQQPFVGTVRVHGIDYYHYIASIGICIFAKRAWKKGNGRRAIGLVKDYLFKTIGLHYLEAGVYAENMNSINVFNHAGFSEQFRVRNKYRHVDRFEEAVYLAAINPAFDTVLLHS
jgi:RimJ/RimL family protein N-acetyltransferase